MRKNSRRVKREWQAAALFLLPGLLGSIIFYFLPFLDTVRRSFYNATGRRFTGLDNYSAVMGNEVFRLAAANTARFTAICIPLLLLVSLIFALMFRFLHPGGGKLKTGYLLPMAIPVVSMAFLWQVLFDRHGIMNQLLASNGMNEVDFINSSAAFWIVTGTYIWKNAGYTIILWIAGLDTIPGQLYEAARVDGAGRFTCFRFITVPGLFPVISMVATLSLLNSFKVFREIYLVTGDYPHDSIYQLQHLFNNWFADLSLNNLSAGATLLCIALLLVISLIQLVFRPRS